MVKRLEIFMRESRNCYSASICLSITRVDQSKMEQARTTTVQQRQQQLLLQ